MAARTGPSKLRSQKMTRTIGTPDDPKRLFIGMSFDEGKAILKRINQRIRECQSWKEIKEALYMKLNLLATLSRLAEGEQKALIEEMKVAAQSALSAAKAAPANGSVPQEASPLDSVWDKRLKVVAQ